ncbi:MAG: tetratricopeptide repeat protein [Oligoflexia bacterium]|nr:tetratricopeptide repeat protein [Oligoflexia bacterium]
MIKLLIFIIIISIAQVADAAPKKRKKTVSEMLQNIASKDRGGNVVIKKKSYVIPATQLPGQSRVMLKEVKPPKSSDLLEDSSDEAKLEKITDEGIAELYSLSQKYSKSKNRGQLWLRLAELYVEKAKYIELRIQRTYDERLEKYQQGKGAKPSLDLSKSREYNSKAIKLYEWFLRDYPKDSRTDQALFFLGYNYMEMGQVKKGSGFYERLTKQFPKSPYIGEAYFALGEYYFENNKWSKAFGYYGQVLKNRRARLYTFALYKQAWCLYRMEKPRSGLKLLEDVVKLSRSGSQTSDEGAGMRAVSRIRLGSEALKDIVLFYGDGGNYKQASDYFLDIGGATAQYPMLEKLAYYYSDQGKKQEAQYVFKQLLDKNPTAPKAFNYQYQIVQNFSGTKNQAAYKAELFTWIDDYGPDSDWARANRSDAKLMEDAFLLRESALRNFTLMLHKNAQNNQKKSDMNQAKEGYALYLSKFSQAAKVNEMRFFYAELLYMMGDYLEAAKEYKFVAEQDKKGQYYESSVLNTLLSLEKTLKTDAQIKQIAGDNLKQIEFDEAEKNFEIASEQYIKTFPRGEKLADVKFKVARLYYSYNQLDEAMRRFRDIIAQHSKTPYAVYSANLILDIHNLRKNYDQLSKEGLSLMRNNDLTQQGFQADVKDLVERASFKKAQDLEVSKNYTESAKAFSEFSRNYPRSPLAPSASYNSAINYERAGQIPAAIVMYKKVLGAPSKGNEKIKEKTTLLLARLYEQTGQYESAAILFERAAAEKQNSKISAELYYNAAVIWEGLKEYSRSITNYEKYFDSSKKRDRTHVLYTIAKIREKKGQLQLAQDAYEKFYSSGDSDEDKIVEAVFKVADINAKRGKKDLANKGYYRTIAAQKKFGQKGAAWAAEAKFRLSEQIYYDLTSLRIPANPKKQGEVIKEKLNLLTRLSNNLTEVIRYDEGNMVIASLATLGRAYAHMSQAIYSAPLPKGLNSQEMEEYKKGVDSVARPLNDKATENYLAAIDKSYSINFYNQWTEQALEAMSKRQPEKFSEPKEMVIPVLKTDDMGILQ